MISSCRSWRRLLSANSSFMSRRMRSACGSVNILGRPLSRLRPFAKRIQGFRVGTCIPISDCRNQAITRFELQSGILRGMGIFRQPSNSTQRGVKTHSTVDNKFSNTLFVSRIAATIFDTAGSTTKARSCPRAAHLRLIARRQRLKWSEE